MPGGTRASSSADPTIRRQFLMAVVVMKVALLSTALGVLFVVFESRTTLGLALVAVGAFAFVVLAARVRAVRADSGAPE